MRIYEKSNRFLLDKKSIVLASGSPRRRELLKTVTKDFEIVFPDVEEDQLKKEFLKKNSVEDLASFLSLKKAQSIESENIILSGDTTVIFNGKILGKPKSYEEARKILLSLFGETHQVTTGVTIFYRGEYFTFSVDSHIIFVDFEDYLEEYLESYLKSDGPYDKAGAYGIQEIGEYFINSIEGDFYNIVGFPITKIRRILYQYGWSK